MDVRRLETNPTETFVQVNLSHRSIELHNIRNIKSLSRKLNKPKLIAKESIVVDPNVIFSNSLSGVIRKKTLYAKIFGNSGLSNSRNKLKRYKQYDYKESIIPPINKLRLSISKTGARRLQPLNQSILAGALISRPASLNRVFLRK